MDSRNQVQETGGVEAMMEGLRRVGLSYRALSHYKSFGFILWEAFAVRNVLRYGQTHVSGSLRRG